MTWMNWSHINLQLPSSLEMKESSGKTWKLSLFIAQLLQCDIIYHCNRIWPLIELTIWNSCSLSMPHLTFIHFPKFLSCGLVTRHRHVGRTIRKPIPQPMPVLLTIKASCSHLLLTCLQHFPFSLLEVSYIHTSSLSSS